MKYLRLFLLAAFSLFGFTACQPDAADSSVEYKIAQTILHFPREGKTLVLSIQTNAQVKAESDASWCQVLPEPSQSSKIVKFAVIVPANEDNASRSAEITLTIGKDIKEIVPVTQDGNPLYVEKNEISLDHNKQEFSIRVSSLDDYSVETEGAWIRFASKSETEAKFTADQNNLPYSRNGKIVFSTSKAKHEVSICQSGYTGAAPAPDKAGMESDAKTLMKKMHLGINLGNTLEATGGETAWGAPYTTEKIILYFKELGFNAIRIPCSWDQNLEDGEGYIIKSLWMDRVKQVVDYVVENDMYAILNIHWDGGWLENDIPNGYSKDVDAKQHAIWTQIAAMFRNYDEHLIFAGTNEPNVENAAHMETLLRYEQTFIDAVRETGGKNAYRVLVFQGPSTDINKSEQLMKTLPKDNVKDRLAAEVHFYDPVQFCLLGEDASWGKMMYFWGKDQKDYATGAYAGKWLSNFNEDHIARQMAKMKKKFWDKGIPVIIGEFGASTWKKFNLGTDEENRKAEEGFRKSHAAYSGCVVKEAKANGCVPFYWHCEGDIIDRSDLRVLLPDSYDAMVEGGKTPYPND